MPSRISDTGTFSQFSNTNTQTRLDIGQLSTQLATGKKAQLSSDFASQAQTYAQNKDSLSENNQYQDNIDTCSKRLDVMEEKVRSINHSLEAFRGRLSQVLSNGGVPDPAFNQFCSNLLQSVANDLNSKDLEGRNLFGGYKTTGQVCDLMKLPNFTLGQPPSLLYAVGDNTAVQVNIDEGVSLTYGVTAFNTGFAETLQCLQIGALNNSDGSASTQLLRQCMTTATQATQDLSLILNNVITSRTQLTEQKQNLEKDEEYFKENLSQIMNADLMEVYLLLLQLEEGLDISNTIMKQIFSKDNLKQLFN